MSVKDNYNRWLNHPNLDAKLKEELVSMDDKQINDAFYTNVEFGTAGMRGVLGAGTNRINIHTIRKANEGFAKISIVTHAMTEAQLLKIEEGLKQETDVELLAAYKVLEKG